MSTRSTRNQKKQSVPVQDPKKDDEPKTRTRGKKDDSQPKDIEPKKKVKIDDSEDKPVKAKSQPKKTKSHDLKATDSIDGKADKPKKTEEKEPAKKAKKQEQKVEPELKKVIMKGGAPVDQFFPDIKNYRVYSDGITVASTTLNQSNIQANNNKFYILQILQNESNPNYFIFFTRWGRVGVPGQQASIPCNSFLVANGQYQRKKREKINGGYRQVQMNYESDKQDDDKKQAKKQPAKKQSAKQQQKVESQLPKTVQQLVSLIFDMKMMNSQMKEIGYDAKKMPLGKLAKNSILKGYEALKGLMQEIKGKKRADVINKLSGDFYSEIPHDFGFQRMQNFVLDTEQKAKAKLEMLQSLEDIQIFTKLLDQGNISNVNQLDSNYLKLDTELTPMDKKSDDYKLLLEYVENTHASTHTAYKLEVLQIFQVKKHAEIARYKKDIGNRQLLWHGSRLTNYVGILSQGLRIAPPEAPVTGYMFGKGVYFADMVTKSANYCFTNRESNTGLMLLCEVALGDINEKFYADYYANLLPPGKSSTKGCGKTAPSKGKHLGDVYVPCGREQPTGIANAALLYNEFIVYDIAQIKTRYLFRMKFNYR